jgi:transposase
MCGVEDRL